MIPIARTENLFIQEVGNELIIYDRETNVSHCLTPIAVNVWRYCNGQNTAEDIISILEKELDISANADVDLKHLVNSSLDELERLSLIEKYLNEPSQTTPISRRKVVKTATLVGGFAVGSMFPLVRSIVAPSPAMASSFINGNSGNNGKPGKKLGHKKNNPGKKFGHKKNNFGKKFGTEKSKNK